MEKTFIDLVALHEWDKNARNISENRYSELKDRISLKGQYKPLLITPDGDGNYTVIGGNMRLRALSDLGLPQALVTVIDFVEREGVWHSVVDGEERPETFSSKENGMMDWNLSDNDEFGYTDADLLANIAPEFTDLDLDKHFLNFTETSSVEDQASNPTDGDKQLSYQVIISADSEDRAQELLNDMLNQGHQAKLKAVTIKRP